MTLKSTGRDQTAEIIPHATSSILLERNRPLRQISIKSLGGLWHINLECLSWWPRIFEGYDYGPAGCGNPMSALAISWKRLDNLTWLS